MLRQPQSRRSSKCPSGSPSSYKGPLSVAISLCLLLLFSAAAQADTVAIAYVTGAKAVNKLKASAASGLQNALESEGFETMGSKHYANGAKKFGAKGAKATTTSGVAKVASRLGIAGVVTGAAWKKGKQYVITLKFIDSSGSVRVNRTYRSRSPSLSSADASGFAQEVRQAVGGGSQGYEEPPPPPPPTQTTRAPVEEESLDKPGGGAKPKTDDAFLPAWARTGGSSGSSSSTASTASEPSASRSSSSSSDEDESSVSRKGKKKKKKSRSQTGAVPDILLAAGMSLNLRDGLDSANSNRHKSGTFPGLRVDGAFFLGTFTDLPVVKDIGFGGMFNMGLGLQYGLASSSEIWDASQMQWQGEFLYRLGFNSVPTSPTILFRIGYGSTSAIIDTDHAMAISAGYSYPYAAVDLHLALYKDVLRVFASGGYLFSVSAAEEIVGSGSGFTARAGLSLNLFGAMHIGAGWDFLKFSGLEYAGSEVSDSYHILYLRLGYNFH